MGYQESPQSHLFSTYLLIAISEKVEKGWCGDTALIPSTLEAAANGTLSPSSAWTNKSQVIQANVVKPCIINNNNNKNNNNNNN